MAVFGGFFLAIKCNGNGCWGGVGGADQRNGFAHGCAGRHDIVHNQHPALKGCANKAAAFAMVFGLFAVVGKGEVAPHARQLDRHSGHQRNAFVRGAEQHVALNAAGDNTLGIELRQFAQHGAIVEQTGIEKIGRLPTGFGDEIAKTQHAAINGKGHKLLGQIIAGRGGRSGRCQDMLPCKDQNISGIAQSRL